MLRDDPGAEMDAVEAILEKVQSIEAVMSSVSDLAEPGQEAERRPVDVAGAIETALQQERARHPDATIVAGCLPSDVSVYANHRLVDVVCQLLANGVEHAGTDEPRVTVDVNTGPDTVTISVADEGPGLPDRNREALEKGTTISEHGDPTTGLGLYLVRLFVRVFRGSVQTEVTDEGTTVSIALERVTESATAESSAPADASVVGVPPAQLGATALAALAAGVVMGAYTQFTTGLMPVIGALYGTDSLLIGGLTHEFHSLVFGLIYAGILTVLPRWWQTDWKRLVAVGAAWGTTLWFFASGLVMPFWLNLVGIPASIPTLSPHSLLAHLHWGAVLGIGHCVSLQSPLSQDQPGQTVFSMDGKGTGSGPWRVVHPR